MLIPWEIVLEDSEEAHILLERLLEIAASDPLIFSEIIRGVLHENPCVKVQAASMVEKVTRVRPLFLTPYKRILLNEFSQISHPGVRQQMAVLYGHVMWDEWELRQVVALLSQWIDKEEDQYIVKHSIESLRKLAMQKEWIIPHYIRCLTNAAEHSNASVSTMAKELLRSGEEAKS